MRARGRVMERPYVERFFDRHFDHEFVVSVVGLDGIPAPLEAFDRAGGRAEELQQPQPLSIIDRCRVHRCEDRRHGYRQPFQGVP